MPVFRQRGRLSQASIKDFLNFSEIRAGRGAVPRKVKSDVVLSRRALNRATLARQMLLSRKKVGVVKAVEDLLGLQAQIPKPPFIALWSRLENFQREQLKKVIHQKKLVRATTMRCTIHLMSTGDFVEFRPALQPALDRALGWVKKHLADLELQALVAAAKNYFEEQPRTFGALRDHFKKHGPRGNERAMAYAVRTQLPLIQVPDDSEWCWPGQAKFAVAETYLGRKLSLAAAAHELALRYLAAFGPATAADFQMWSSLPSMKQVFEDLRPQLRTFRDEQGRELFDLPNAPRPDEDTPAPARYLPDYDNLVLGHADRTRLIEDAHRKRIATTNLRILATFLADGRVAGVWRQEHKNGTALLVVTPFYPLEKQVKIELENEGLALLHFLEPDAGELDVRFEKPKG